MLIQFVWLSTLCKAESLLTQSKDMIIKLAGYSKLAERLKTLYVSSVMDWQSVWGVVSSDNLQWPYT